MNISIHPTLENGRKALDILKSHAEKVADRGLSASSAALATAERAGQRTATALSRSANDISQSVREHMPARASDLASLPAVNRVARVARRHPAALLAAGVAAGAVFYAAWRIMHHAQTADSEHEMD